MAQQLRTDRILFYTIVVMVFFGLVIVYSASSVMAELKFGSPYYFIGRQVAWAVVAFMLLMYLKSRDYRRYHAPVWAFAPMGILLALLVVVYFADPRRHRWLNFSSIGIQPSEFAKPALAIFLAYFITRRLRAINDRHTLFPALIALGVLLATVVVADLGTAVVLFMMASIVFFVAGLSRKHMIIAAGGALLLVAGAILVKPYRVARIIGYLDHDYSIIQKFDPSGNIKAYVQRSMGSHDNYQVRQSLIAVGSGGVLGQGLMQGKQKLLYLPEAHNDFIYAVIGEELGLWGTLAILTGFFIVIWRGFRLFWIAPDDFGKYLALGLTVSIAVQALINISVVLDIGPAKGFPLPMISYGGSSLLSTLASMGLLLSVSEHAG